MNVTDYALRAANLAIAQVSDRAHVVSGAGGARPGQRDGMLARPDGVILEPARTDPADPSVFTARCGTRVCAGRFDSAAGGIAGGRLARRTDIDLLVYLAELASLPERDWQPFFEYFSPRRLDDGSTAGRIVWGEDCRGRRHFDAPGLINWCFEQAVDARYSIAFDAATWATEASGTVPVTVTEPPRPGDLVFTDHPDGSVDIGILVASRDTDDHGLVVHATRTAAGVVCRRYAPSDWNSRRRPGHDLLHN